MPTIDGVITENVIRAGSAKPRNELTIGGLMPWAGTLWVQAYIAHQGHGAGLFSMDSSLKLVKH